MKALVLTTAGAFDLLYCLAGDSAVVVIMLSERPHAVPPKAHNGECTPA